MPSSSDVLLPEYVIHDSERICGFFGLYRFLSNFFSCPNGIWYEGVKYHTVEHAYQCAKFPQEDRCNLLNLNVKQIKKAGRNVNLPSNWELIKFDIMYQLVFQKFYTHDFLKSKLILTKNKYLEERNNWGDFFWGTNEQGKGQNNLGKILMHIRELWL